MQGQEITEEPNYLAELHKTAARFPEHVAVLDGENHITYSSFMSAVHRRAEILEKAGLKVGDRVALVAENSGEYLVTALAVWAAGGVLATIYPSTGLQDMAYTLENSDPVLVIADELTHTTVRQAVTNGTPVAVVGDNFAVERLRSGAMASPDLRAPLHMICYSSGTTSRPKAIMLTQLGLYNGARTFADVWRLGPKDKTIVALPMAWLYGLATTSMATLLAGGTVIPLRRARPELLVSAIEEHGATFLPGVTSIFTKLVEYLDNLHTKPVLSSLRLAVAGGEPRNEAAFDRFTKYTGVPVLDNYSASECFPLITSGPDSDLPPRGSSGKLVPRAKLKIVDPEGVEVSPGQPGEAYSQGPGLMLGYWRDPEQTSAVLTSDGWYRTKDLVRVDEDGHVFVVGRLSDMIIRGGNNVSPAEVERVLIEHPSVREVAVVGLPDDMYGQQIAAVIVPDGKQQPDIADIEQFANERLAGYKRPSRYFVSDDLPRNTTTGKVDRRQVAASLGEGVS